MAGTTHYLQHLLVSWPLARALHLYQVYQCIFHFSYCLDYTRGVMHFCDCGLPVNLEFLNRYLIRFWKHFKAVCWKVWTNLRNVVLNCTQNFFVAADTILQYVSWLVCVLGRQRSNSLIPGSWKHKSLACINIVCFNIISVTACETKSQH